MKWLKRFSISLTVAFFAVCCGAVLLFNWSALGWKALSVPTGSMRPHIPPGSLVLVHRVPVASIHVGDVITYANPLDMRKTITHRVIKSFSIDNGKIPAFITKGDANPSADPNIVIGGQVVGQAVWHIPDVGGWLTWGKGWPGIISLVYIPALIMIIGEIQRLNEYFRVSRSYKAAKLLLQERLKPQKKHRLAQATTISIALVASSALLAFPAEALLRSNTVTLGPNTLTVAKITPPPQCSTNSTTVTTTGGGNTTVVVNNSSSQTGSSGNVTVTGNTNGGSATSGSVSNTNCTNININIH